MILNSWKEIALAIGCSPYTRVAVAALHAGALAPYVRQERGRYRAQADALPAIREAVLSYQRNEAEDAEAERAGEYGPWVPASYFRTWLRGTLADPSVTLAFLAQEMQLDPRRLWNWADEEKGASHIPYLLLENALWNYKCIHVERICPPSAILIARPMTPTNRETEDDRQEANDGRDTLGGPSDVRGRADGEERERAGDAEGVPGQRHA